MKKILASLVLLVMFTNLAVYAENIAVVDLQQLVASSSKVKQLNQEHSRQVKELDKILINARGEISAEKDPAKVLILEDKYMNEFNAKKKALESDYNHKLADIESNIKQEIQKKATADSYDYVFAKSVVLFGGKDITNEIKNNIK